MCHRLDDRVQCESSDSCDSDFFSNREMKYLSACLQCFNGKIDYLIPILPVDELENEEAAHKYNEPYSKSNHQSIEK